MLRDLREQPGQELSVHHHRGNNHAQESLSAKVVLRAGGQRDKHEDEASITQDAQTGWKINVLISKANNVILNYHSQTVLPRCAQQLGLLYRSPWLQAAGSQKVWLGAQGCTHIWDDTVEQ